MINFAKIMWKIWMSIMNENDIILKVSKRMFENKNQETVDARWKDNENFWIMK